jgi:hypothetical protein
MRDDADGNQDETGKPDTAADGDRIPGSVNPADVGNTAPIGKRGRGRPRNDGRTGTAPAAKGGTAKKAENVSVRKPKKELDLRITLAMFHARLAQWLDTPAVALTETQATELSDAIKTVDKEWDILPEIPTKWQALFVLGITSASIYGPMLAAIRQRRIHGRAPAPVAPAPPAGNGAFKLDEEKFIADIEADAPQEPAHILSDAFG